jgi:hypothetical protein
VLIEWSPPRPDALSEQFLAQVVRAADRVKRRWPRAVTMRVFWEPERGWAQKLLRAVPTEFGGEEPPALDELFPTTMARP